MQIEIDEQSYTSEGMMAKLQFDGLVQDCSNSSAFVMGLLQSCT